jgi:ferredoxin-NADP reductase
VAVYRFPLSHKRTIAGDVIELGFDTSGSAFSFRPGQYVRVVLEELESLGLKESYRELSMVNSPHDHELRVAFRQTDSRFKRELLRKPLGEHITIEGPFGAFTPETTQEPLVFVAFGIGITPFMSILSTVSSLSNIQLLYVSSADSPLAYEEELQILKKAGLALQTAARAEYQNKLDQLLSDEAKYYISGPPDAVKDCYQYLTNRNIIKAAVVIEEFTGCEDG